MDFTIGQSPFTLSSGEPKCRSVLFQTIAIIRTVYKEKHGTPRQGQLTSTARAKICMHRTVPSIALEGIDAYSHVWLLFVFDKNRQTNACWKVQPPKLDRRVGVFATRTPHRPSPIGMTVVRLERVEGTVLHVTGVDIVDGTHILDIKPYHWADKVSKAQLRVPEWMVTPSRMTVLFTKHASRCLEQLFEEVGLDVEKRAQSQANYKDGFYSSMNELRRAIVDILQHDPRSRHSIAKHDAGIYGIQLDLYDVVYQYQMLSAEGNDSDKSECIHVVDISLHADASDVPRLRTQAWYEAIQRKLASCDMAIINDL